MQNFRLGNNWIAVLKKAWSIRLMLIAALFSAAEVALPLLQGALPVSKGWFAALSGISVAGAFLSRLMVQKELDE